MSNAQQSDDSILFPPLPEELAAVAEAIESLPESAGDTDFYTHFLETQCGTLDDSQAVELYDGTLGVAIDFVNTHQQPVGQLQWNDNLGAIYDNPGNVSGVRWCTGTLISDNLFLTAGHCFDQTGGGWQRPRINGTNTIIPAAEIATNMHINFNYQVDSNNVLRPEVEFAIEALMEYRIGNLDYAIVRLAGSPGQQFGMGTVAQADAAEGDMLCIIGHPAGVPKRIEAGPLSFFSGDRLHYDSIDTLGGNSGSAMWHSPSGEIVGVHTNGGCTNSGGSNSGVRIGRIVEVSPLLQAIAFPPLPLVFRHGAYSATVRPRSTYTMRQVSSGRFMDAHQSGANDFGVVTRTAQNNATQRWIVTPVSVVCTIQQVSSGRFVDAHQNSDNDFSVVTRSEQNNDTQRWILTYLGANRYTIQQQSSNRYLDAYESAGNDFRLVTRTAQNNNTQRWHLTHLGNGTYTMQQVSSSRFMDAHQSGANDFRLVTRTAQNNDTQRWVLTLVGSVNTIQQSSSGRYLDAHQNGANDFRLVTRTAQNNNTQRWMLGHLGDDLYTIQQQSTRRFVDAHQNAGNDFAVVTRTAQNNDTQRWLVEPE